MNSLKAPVSWAEDPHHHLRHGEPDADMLGPWLRRGPGSPFQDPDMPSSDALEVLKMHRADRHPPAEAQAVHGGQAREVCPQAEHVKRPTLSLSGQSID